MEIMSKNKSVTHINTMETVKNNVWNGTTLRSEGLYFSNKNKYHFGLVFVITFCGFLMFIRCGNNHKFY